MERSQEMSVNKLEKAQEYFGITETNKEAIQEGESGQPY